MWVIAIIEGGVWLFSGWLILECLGLKEGLPPKRWDRADGKLDTMSCAAEGGEHEGQPVSLVAFTLLACSRRLLYE